MIQLNMLEYGERFTIGRYKTLSFDYSEKYVVLFDNIENKKYKATYNMQSNMMELEEWKK